MSDPGRRLALLNMAQAWTDLADHAQRSGKEDGFFRDAGTPLPA